MALNKLLDKTQDTDFLRGALESILQVFMEKDVAVRINAAWHERTTTRDNYRNGFRERSSDSGVGTLNLRIPKLRRGSYFPDFLEVRRMSEKALLAVIQEAWINGVSTSP